MFLLVTFAQSKKNPGLSFSTGVEDVPHCSYDRKAQSPSGRVAEGQLIPK